MNKDGYVLGIGAANADIFGIMKNDLAMNDSNPGDIVVSVGGVTHNVLANFAKMGGKSKIITSVGDDVYSSIIEQDCKDMGIDTADIFHLKNTPSATHMAVVDNIGSVLVGVSALDTHRLNTTLDKLEYKNQIISGAELIVCDTSLSTETLKYIIDSAGDTPVFVNPVSAANSARLQGIVSRFHTVTPNLIELQAMSGVEVSTRSDIERGADVLLSGGTQCVIVTLGSDGCYYKGKNGESFFSKLKPLEKVVSAVGAGDAFMAGVIYGFVNKFSTIKMIDTALAAGIIGTQSSSTVNPAMSLSLIKETILKYKL